MGAGMKNTRGCDSRVHTNHSVLYENGRKRHILWLTLLMLFIFLLFHMGSYLTEKYQLNKSEHQVDRVTAAQELFHRMAGKFGIFFNYENDQTELKAKSNKLIWLTAPSLVMLSLLTYFNNYKIRWIKSIFFTDLLQILIYYIYQSDGKKRKLAYI
jgi:hypothetical protein